MLMPSATALGRQSVLQVTTPIPHFHTPITVGAFWSTLDSTAWEGRYLWYKVLYAAHSYVYMAVWDMEMKLV